MKDYITARERLTFTWDWKKIFMDIGEFCLILIVIILAGGAYV